MKTIKTFQAAGRSEWRAWLQEHHDREAEVWLEIHKKHTGRPSVSYQEALEEALCFGWIDGIHKGLDEESFTQRFSPRRADSRWSERNKHLAARLLREGRMKKAGLAKVDFPLPEADAPITPRPELPLPDWLGKALKSHPKPWENFNRLPPSHRRNYISWISEAKKEETRRRRIQEAVSMLEKDERLGPK